jgi:hypothetical protein
MNEHHMSEKSEDEIAHEWREYYAKLFIIPKYPHALPEQNPQIEKLIEGLYSEALPEAKRKHLQDLFSKARTAALKTVQEFQISPDAKEKISAKLKAVDLVFLKKLKGSSFEKHPLESLWWGIAYDPIPGKINVGAEALRYGDDQTIFSVFAHEMGHAFDPCRWGALFSGADPFASVIGCLRSSASVGAKARDDSQLESMLKAGKLGPDLVASLQANPTCNKLEYPPVGVQGDQINESFADWFSAEVLARSPEFAKLPLRTDLCGSEELSKGSSYPSSMDRLTKIYFANPALKKLAGDSASSAVYCSLTPAMKN